ncbi:TonB-dependent receptor, partial [Xanthomonas hyacinthi DSM 19077]
MRTHLFNVHLNDLGNAVNDLSLARDFGNGDGGNFNLKAGWYTSRQKIDADWTWNSYVQSLSQRSRLLDVIAADGSALSQNGLYAYGVPYWGGDNTRHYDVRYDINAPYLALGWDQGALNVDASLRYDMGK